MVQTSRALHVLGSSSVRRLPYKDAALLSRFREVHSRVRVGAGIEPSLPDLAMYNSSRCAEAVSGLAHACIARLATVRSAEIAVARLLEGAVLDLQKLATDLYLHEMSSRTHRLAGCSTALDQLRGAPTVADLLERVCEDLAQRCGFRRVVLSRVDEGTWKPWKAFFGDLDSPLGWFSEWIDREIPFGTRSPESALLTDRRPAIVYDTESSPVYRPIIVESGHSSSYAVSALVLDGKIIGLVHVDHFPVPTRIDDADRDVLWAFTEGLGYVYERTLLIERIRNQRNEFREILASAADRMDDLCESGITLAGDADIKAQSSTSNAGLSELTTRERDVFDLLTVGATNSEIADKLVITHGTAKSHVKQILRKLGVVNRSQVISWSIANGVV